MHTKPLISSGYSLCYADIISLNHSSLYRTFVLEFICLDLTIGNDNNANNSNPDQTTQCSLLVQMSWFQ